MTRQELKSLLWSYESLSAESRQIRDEIERLRTSIASPKAQKLTGMPSGGRSIDDPLVSPVSNIIKLEQRYQEQLERIYEAQNRIEQLIEPLPPKLRMLMRCRYIGCKRWEEVCVEVGYEWTQTHRMHSAALDIILRMEGGEADA